MTSSHKDPVLVVLQLSGGNDYFNTVIPHTDPLYRDNRPAVGIPDDKILQIDGGIGLHSSLGVIRDMYNQGDVAIIHGVGYPNSPRSHFRSMDICTRDIGPGTPVNRIPWEPRAGWAWPQGT